MIHEFTKHFINCLSHRVQVTKKANCCKNEALGEILKEADKQNIKIIE